MLYSASKLHASRHIFLDLLNEISKDTNLVNPKFEIIGDEQVLLLRNLLKTVGFSVR